MIEVNARILQRSVFIPEENIDCEVVVTNHADTDKKSDVHLNESSENLSIHKNNPKNASNKHDYITIAWASAQIYCQCDVNERRVKIPSSLLQKHHKGTVSTSFTPVVGEKGHCLLTTEANVLFCNLKLKKGETKKFIYSEKIPCDAPPSYKGQNVKFSYNICIGIAQIGQPLCMLQLPFRLFQLKGILKKLKSNTLALQNTLEDSSQIDVESSSTSLTEHDSVPTVNPFLEEDISLAYSTLDAAMDALTTFTVKRNLNTYNIQSPSGPVGKFCLSKHYYRLGEDIFGTFDFSESKINCIKFAVSLQIEESISKQCLVQQTGNNYVHYNTLSRHEECCYLASKTNFLLPIPVTSTPEFIHKIVSICWRLHFEFTIEANDNLTTAKKEEDNDMNNLIPSKLTSEFMLWDLPINVVATNPILASIMMQAESSESLTFHVSS